MNAYLSLHQHVELTAKSVHGPERQLAFILPICFILFFTFFTLHFFLLLHSSSYYCVVLCKLLMCLELLQVFFLYKLVHMSLGFKLHHRLTPDLSSLTQLAAAQ